MNTYEALLRQRVDPDGVLPPVYLEELRRPSSHRRAYTARVPLERVLNPVLGTCIGMITLARVGDSQLWFPNWVALENKYPGKGYGTSLYIAAAGLLDESGDALRSTNGMLSPEAKAVWNRFVERGVAEVITEYVREPNDDRFSGGEMRFLTEEQLRNSSPKLTGVS